MKNITAFNIIEALFLATAVALLFSDSNASELPRMALPQTLAQQTAKLAPPETEQERREAQQVAEHMPSPLGPMKRLSVARNPQIGPRHAPSPRGARK